LKEDSALPRVGPSLPRGSGVWSKSRFCQYLARLFLAFLGVPPRMLQPAFDRGVWRVWRLPALFLVAGLDAGGRERDGGFLPVLLTLCLSSAIRSMTLADFLCGSCSASGSVRVRV